MQYSEIKAYVQECVTQRLSYEREQSDAEVLEIIE